MSPLWFVFVVLVVLVARIVGHYQFRAGSTGANAMKTFSVLGGIALLLMLTFQCMMSGSEGARGGRRGRGGRGRPGCWGGRCRQGRAVNRVLHGGGGGWTGYVPWWLYPSYYFPWGGWSGWSPYPDPYPPGYGPSAYLPRVYPVGPCAQGCMADSTGTYGCPFPGYYPGQCRFASDCQGCAPGGVPALAIA